MNKHGHIIIPLTLLFVFISFTIAYYLNTPTRKTIVENTKNANNTTTSTPESNTYKNELSSFRITFDIPENFNAKELFNTITLANNTKKIEISKISTNFANVDEYFKDTTKRGQIEYISKEEITINNKKVIKTIRTLDDSKEELAYWIYHDYKMYFVSTTDKDLYPIAEEVAHSIKFTD